MKKWIWGIISAVLIIVIAIVGVVGYQFHTSVSKVLQTQKIYQIQDNHFVVNARRKIVINRASNEYYRALTLPIVSKQPADATLISGNRKYNLVTTLDSNMKLKAINYFSKPQTISESEIRDDIKTMSMMRSFTKVSKWQVRINNYKVKMKVATQDKNYYGWKGSTVTVKFNHQYLPIKISGESSTGDKTLIITYGITQAEYQNQVRKLRQYMNSFN